MFNYLLIGGNFGFPRLGVAGAAVATVIGTVAALVMAVYSVSHPGAFLHLKISREMLRFRKKTLRSIADIGSSSLAEQLFLRFGFLTYAMIVARLGTTAFAAHQVGMNIISISFAFGDGLSVAAVALVGQSLGERRRDLARVYLSLCQRLGLVCSLAVAGSIRPRTRHFPPVSDETEILAYGDLIMRMVAVIVVMQVAQVISSGCLRGAGDTRYVALVSLISVACVRRSPATCSSIRSAWASSARGSAWRSTSLCACCSPRCA